MNLRKATFIGPSHPYRGGIAAFNQQLADCFSQNKWDVQLENYKYQYPSILFPGKNQYTDDPSGYNLKSRRSIHSLNPINWLKEGKRIATEHPELVIGQYWMPFIAMSLGSSLRMIKKNNSNAKTISIVHNLIPHESRPGDMPLTKYMLNSSDYFVSLSKAVAKDILDIKPDAKVINLFHPTYTNYGSLLEKSIAKSALNLDEHKDYILFFGLVRAYKGLDLLLEALAKSENKNLELLVVGEFYDDENKYLSLIDDLKIKDRVHIRNQYIPDDQLKYYFSAADCICLPYKTATQSGISQIAIHFEKAMIATDVGGLSEVVINNENGFLVRPDASEIKLAIDKFYGQNLKQKFSEGSKALKYSLSWQNFYNKLLEGIQ